MTHDWWIVPAAIIGVGVLTMVVFVAVGAW